MYESPTGHPDVTVKVVIWDTAGQERFQSMAKAFYQKAHGVFICFDTTRRVSYDSIKRWQRAVQDNCVGRVPTMLIGTKIDLDDEREVSE